MVVVEEDDLQNVAWSHSELDSVLASVTAVRHARHPETRRREPFDALDVCRLTGTC